MGSNQPPSIVKVNNFECTASSDCCHNHNNIMNVANTSSSCCDDGDCCQNNDGCDHDHSHSECHNNDDSSSHHHNHNHSHSHDHHNEHNHQKHITTPYDVNDVDIPTWKKVALQTKLDSNEAPFQMKDWNQQISFVASSLNYKTNNKCCHDHSHTCKENMSNCEAQHHHESFQDQHSHEHSHEHSHDHQNHHPCCTKNNSNNINDGHHESHDHSHDHNECCSSSSYHHANSHDHIPHHPNHKNNNNHHKNILFPVAQQSCHPKPVYIAIIKDHAVDVYDINGEMKTFKCKTHFDMKRVCFSSHGNHDLDSLLTPCFDDNGCHGKPKSICFCGIEDPHIHAHFKDDLICNIDKGMEVSNLSNLTLFPDEEDYEDEEKVIHDTPATSDTTTTTSDPSPYDSKKRLKRQKSIPLSESLPIQCNSKEYKRILTDRGLDESSRQKMFQVFHHDHYDILVHNQNTGNLQLEHSCNDCGDTDIHGHLKLAYERLWNVGNNEGIVTLRNEYNSRLNFYKIPKKAFGLLDAFADIFKTDSTDRVNIIRRTTPKRKQKIRHYTPKCCSIASCPNESDFLITPNFCNEDITTDVQSKIFVQDICCASEIPMINDVVKPLKGVSDVRVNTTTKMVYVNHDPDEVSAVDIVSALNKQNFGAKLKLDGSIAFRDSRAMSSTTVQSKIFVQHICCASEIPIINDVIKPLAGVTDVKVNTMSKIVYVNHDPNRVSAVDIEAALNKANFGAKLELDGATKVVETESVSMSSGIKFVESTFLVSSWFDDEIIHNIRKIMKEQYTEDQVSHIDAHLLSRTIKVDHNPLFVKATTIKSFLADKDIDVSIITDGFEQGIWTIKTEDDIEYHKPRLQWNVALSGAFWIISLFYLIGGNWKYLEYVGLVSVALGIPKIGMKALATLRRFQFDTNCMMLFATIGAVGLQEYTEAAAVAFLFSLSEWLESLSTARARNALSSIAKLRPERARIKDHASNSFRIVAATVVPIGSVVSVMTGDKVPCDGIIVDGMSTMDESSLTGESRPIRKGIGDSVSGGTINAGRANILVQTTSLADDSAVARLIRLVEEAQTNRSPTEQLIDEFAKRYTPIVVLAAISMCSFPWIVSVQTGKVWTEIGLITIVIACPCALIISTPVTYVAGIAAAAQKGIVVKGGVHLEAISRVTKIAFDKTGTLTEGNFKLLELHELSSSIARKEIFRYLRAMEENASHPLAVAIVAAAKIENVSVPDDWSIQNHQILDGEGVTAFINGEEVFVGNMRLFERLGLLEAVPEEKINDAMKWMESGCTVGFLSIKRHGIVGSYCVADSVRVEANEVLSGLSELNIESIMLTGDNNKAALHIGNTVGLTATHIKSQLLPHEKLKYITDIVSDSMIRHKSCLALGRRNDLILMCGDGVNDAPALTMADVGVAMGLGAAIAMESADVTLLDSDLRKLLHLVKLSKRVSRTIIQNIVFSLAAKALVMALTFAGYTNLWAAIGSDVGAMLVVTANGMKLLPSKRSIKNQTGYDSKRIERDGDVEEQHLFPLELESDKMTKDNN